MDHNKNVTTGSAFWIFLLSAVLFSVGAAGQNTPVSPAAARSLKQAVTQAARSTATIFCEFRQEKVMNMISEQITSTGRFYLKKEKMMRWEYIRPFSYVIIINNDRITIKDENKISRYSVQSSRVFLEISKIIEGSIRGTLLTDEKHFKASLFENPAAWVVKLKPLDAKMKEALDEIVIWFNRKDYSVDRVEMNEPGGDCTRITFTSKTMNQPIADEKFTVD
jgi:outer membrane lipoprotein-sorting protein